jgi:hypothetical protein
MHSSGFSVTFVLGWIITGLAVVSASSVLSTESGKPAIVLAAEVLTITSFSLLILVPMILLSMLRNSRRTAALPGRTSQATNAKRTNTRFNHLI